MGNSCCSSPQIPHENFTLIIHGYEFSRTQTSLAQSSNSLQTNLILPASRNASSFQIKRYYLLYSFHMTKYKESLGDKKLFQNLFIDYFITCTQGREEKFLQLFQLQLKSIIKADQAKFIQERQARLNQLLLKYALQSDILLQQLNKILLASEDLKSLAYFIFPIHGLFAAIQNNFIRPELNRKDNIWIVAILQKKDIMFLKQMKGVQGYFLFSAFMRGFTDNKCAKEAFHKMKGLSQSNKKRTFLFTVNFPYDYTILSSQQNKGFFICKDASSEVKARGDVIFNIMTSFKLGNQSHEFEYDIDYGQLARMCDQKSRDRFLIKDQVPLRIYQQCRGKTKFELKSRSSIYRLIGEREQAFNLSNSIRSIIQSSDNVNKSDIIDIQRYNIVNTHIENNQFDQALESIRDSTSLLFKAKKIEILYGKKDFEAAKAEIEAIKNSELKESINLQSRLVIDLVSAKICMSNKYYKKAQEKLKSLYQAVKKEYPEDFQYIGRDVITAMIECDKNGGVKSNLEPEVQWGAGSYIPIYKCLNPEKIE